MLSPYIVCGEDRDERCGRGSFFNMRPSFGFLPLDQAHHGDHFESEFACRFYGLHSRTAGCADIVDNDDLRAALTKALNPLSGAVLLFRFADQKAVNRST